MNEFLTLLGIEPWKAVLSSLALPPVPLIFLILVGARLIPWQRSLGWLVILFCVTCLWLGACIGTSKLLVELALGSPRALTLEEIKAIKAESATKKVAIVVLGTGVLPLAPEYGTASLTPLSLARLRYGLWLHRETGVPVAFSGGVGRSQGDSQPEAIVAGQIATRDFGSPIKWVEDRSRDTREHAIRTVSLLKGDGVTHLILVTNGWHMRRSMLMFEQRAIGSMTIQAAPMGLRTQTHSSKFDWLPSAEGFMSVNQALHEILAIMLKA